MENKSINFEIGDFVFLMDPTGIHTIEKNKSYKVISVHKNFKGNQLIALEGVISNYNNDEDPSDPNVKHPFFNSKRFVKNIKPIRKKKLDKIYGR